MALYSTNDFGAADIYIDNILACKASSSVDSLTLNSLISKNTLATGGTEPWLPIRSINGTTVKIFGGAANTPTSDRGYYGTTEAAPVYKRETIQHKTYSNVGTNHQIQESGTAASPITYSGGYSTATNSQDGESYFDGCMVNSGCAIHGNSMNYITLDRIDAVRFNRGILAGTHTSTTTSIGWNITAQDLNGCSRGLVVEGQNHTASVTNASHNSEVGFDYLTSGAQVDSRGSTFTFVNINSNAAAGVFFHNCADFDLTATNICYNLNDGINFDPAGPETRLFVTNVKSNSIYGFNVVSGGGVIYDYGTAFASNGTSAFRFAGDFYPVYCKDVTIGEATKITYTKNFSTCGVYITSYGGDTADHRQYLNYGNVVTQAATRVGGTGLEWKLSPTNTLRGSGFPIRLSLAKIACTADNLVTVKAWCKLSHATDIGAKLVCRGGQIAGVAADVTDTKAADTDWEELSFTFTPTEAGVVEIEGWGYWLANTADENALFGNMTITQA